MIATFIWQTIFTRKPSVLAVVWAACGVFLLGCQKPVSISDVQGTWVPDQASSRVVKSTNACRVVIQPDGGFTAVVPDYLMVTFDKASGRAMAGSGHWVFEEGAVKLNFNEVDGERINWGSRLLQPRGSTSGAQLYFYLGEEGGERFVFHRAN